MKYLGPKTRELLVVLEEFQTMLKIYGETEWEKVIRDARALIENSDFRGINTICVVIGGMGSLGDLIICKLNGHPIDEDEEGPINKRLEELKCLASGLAVEIRREVELDLRKN